MIHIYLVLLSIVHAYSHLDLNDKHAVLYKEPTWMEVCNGSYYFSNETATWDEAGEYCKLFGDGSHLLQRDNKQENNCLLRVANKHNLLEQYWHSANDIQVEGILVQWDSSEVLWQPLWGQWGPGPE